MAQGCARPEATCCGGSRPLEGPDPGGLAEGALSHQTPRRCQEPLPLQADLEPKLVCPQQALDQGATGLHTGGHLVARPQQEVKTGGAANPGSACSPRAWGRG